MRIQGETVKLFYKPCATLEQRNAIRAHCKPFETSDLSIVLTDNFTYKGSKTGRILTFKHSKYGVFRYFPHKGRGHAQNQYGFKHIPLPAIIVNPTHESWWSTFLHEFGHYLDYKTNPFYFKESTRRKEKTAKTYSALTILSLNPKDSRPPLFRFLNPPNIKN